MAVDPTSLEPVVIQIRSSVIIEQRQIPAGSRRIKNVIAAVDVFVVRRETKQRRLALPLGHNGVVVEVESPLAVPLALTAVTSVVDDLVIPSIRHFQ